MFHTILLVIKLLFIITITCYPCTKHRSKHKRIGTKIIQKEKIRN